MATTNLTSSLAYFPEVTQGTGPANAAAWVASGQRIRHIAESLEASSFKQTMIEDMRSQEAILARETKVFGIKGGVEFAFDAYGTGQGAATAPAAQIALTPLMTLLAHCFGGVHRSNTSNITAGTTTTVTVTSATNIILGCLVLIQDADDPNRPVVRRVVGIAGLVLTLDRALPFTAANGDVCHAMATIYVDETALVDSAIGPTTMSWLISKGGTGTNQAAREHWEARGCKGMLEGIELARNALPLLKFKVLVASFLTPEAAPEPTWTADPAGNAPVGIGPDTQVNLANFGATPNTLIHCSECSVQTGVSSVPVDTLTEVNTGMPGRYGYTLAQGETKVGLQIVPMAQAEFTEFNAQTLKIFNWQRIRPAGAVFSVHLSRAEIEETPGSAAVGNALGETYALRGLRDAANASATEQLWRSPILIGIG